MNKNIAIELRDYAELVAVRFSGKNRDGNFNKESFLVKKIIPMSDTTATVIFEKSSGKKAAFFFYYISRGASKGWRYFVPTDAHIVGMMTFNVYKAELEKNNFNNNF